MPFNGSGGTTQPTGSIYPATGNTLIESGKANTSIADLYSMLAGVICKDGQTTTTLRIPFASGISTDTVNELTSNTGITLDGVLLKDGRIDTTQGADIACSATIDLETTTGNVVDVTGSTGPVTAITLSQGHWRIVRFTGTPTLTHGASLVLPGAVNIVVAAGDYAVFAGYASSVVRCIAYQRASGEPVAPFVDTNAIVKGSSDATKKLRFEVDGLTTTTTRVITMPDNDVNLSGLGGTQSANTFLSGPTSGSAALPTFRAHVGADGASWVLLATSSASGSATVDLTTGITSTYDEYVITVTDLVPANNGTNVGLRISQDGGATFKAGAGTYRWARNVTTDGATNVPGGSASDTIILMTSAVSSTVSQSCSGWVKFSGPAGTASAKKVRWEFTYMDSGPTMIFGAGGGAYTADVAAINGIRFIMSSGNITSGTFALYGIRKT